MGARGPVPKRSSERRRRNKASTVETVAVPTPIKKEPPKANSKWHPVAKDWFNSLSDSGQSQFYEPSDWQVARFWGEVMSRALRSPRLSAQLVSAIGAGMTDLLTTEASRRRVRMEIERPGEALIPASVTALADYRKTLGA